MEREIENRFEEAINDVVKMVQLNRIPDNVRFRLLRDLYERGVDIKVILTAIFSVMDKWYEKTGFIKLEVDFSKTLSALEQHNRKARVIKNAIRTLLREIKIPRADSLLAYGHTEAFDKIVRMQTILKECEPAIDEYLGSVDLRKRHTLNLNTDDFFNEIQKAITLKQKPHLKGKFYNYKLTSKGKATSSIKLTQSTQGVWNECIVTIVNELNRIYDGYNKSYTKTAELLGAFYPKIYKDTDPDLVRQRYTSSKKK